MLMGGVGWGMLTSCSMSSLQPASKVWDRAPWKLWKRTSCSMLQQGCWRWNNNEQKKGDYQHVPFHANIKNIANTNKKKTALHITPRTAVKTVLFQLKKINDFHEMCYFVWENKKIRNFEKEHVAAGWWSWSNNEQKKGWLSTCAVSC